MAEQLRILHVVTTMNLGGLENFIMNIYRSIDRNKIQFDFLMHRQERSSFEEEIVLLGGRVYRLSAIRPSNYFSYIAELKFFFKKHPEYLIVHSHINESSALILSVAKKAGVPVRIAHSHTSAKAQTYGVYRQLLKSRIAGLSTFRLACSTSAGKWMFGTADFKKVNNSINVQKFKFNPASRLKIRNSLQINQNEIVLGNVSRFNVEKNHKFLLQIFYLLSLKFNNFRLILVGDGLLMNQIKQNVQELNLEEKVTFTGTVMNPEDYLSAMDIYVFPSLFEGLPLALVEAQANGLPIIMSDSISEEVILSDLVKSYSLSSIAEQWATEIINRISKIEDNNRQKYAKVIMDMDFDAVKTAKSFELFYLKTIEKLN